MNETEISKLVDKLNEYREKYYNEGISVISDEEFDFEERRLREMDPNNEYFRQVGRTIDNLTRDIKVTHKVPMLSMQKVQVAQDAVKWLYDLSKIPGLYFDDSIGLSVWVDPKLDGISGKIVFDSNGKFSYASTRGDGKVGAKLPFANFIDGVPKQFLPECELRGEFIINKNYSKLLNGPLRNICSGILKRKDYSDDIKYVSFVIYDFHAYNPKYDINFKDRGDKINQIAKILSEFDQKFNIVPVIKTNNIPDIYSKYVKNLRKHYAYETDGIILTVDGGQDNYDLINSKYVISTCNRYNMALKPPAEFASTHVKGIEIFVNRQKLSFVAVTEPVFINGVCVSRATLDNYQNMRKLKIGIGSTVLLKRSNDVIPKIVESYNEEGVNIKYINPKVCPICGANLVKYYQDLACPNEYGCKGIFKSKLNMLFTSLGVKNIGPSFVSDFVDYLHSNYIEFTFTNVFTILKRQTNKDISSKLIFDNFLNQTYNGGKRIEIFNNSIKWMFENLYEMKVLNGFNIPSIGEGELIKHNIRSFKDLIIYINELNKKNLFDSAFDTILYKWAHDGSGYHICDLENTYNIIKNDFKKETGIKEGAITYCISGEVPGMKKSEVVSYLKELNPELAFVKDVSVSTNFLISYETGTTKVLKAKKYNIPVYTLEETVAKFKK